MRLKDETNPTFPLFVILLTGLHNPSCFYVEVVVLVLVVAVAAAAVVVAMEAEVGAQLLITPGKIGVAMVASRALLVNNGLEPHISFYLIWQSQKLNRSITWAA